MKTRLDFVSNSSSSSYILAVEDNPHMMVLDDPDILTFRELVDRFGRRLFSPSEFFEYRAVPRVEISEEEFVQRFIDDTEDHLKYLKRLVFEDVKLILHLPPSVLELYKVYDMVHNDFDKIKKKWPLDNYDMAKQYSMMINSVQDAIVEECYRIVEPVFKDTRFCYQEVEDTAEGPEYDILDENPFDLSIDPDKKSRKQQAIIDDVLRARKYQTFIEPLVQPDRECLVDERIKLMAQFKGKLKFMRKFSNH